MRQRYFADRVEESAALVWSWQATTPAMPGARMEYDFGTGHGKWIRSIGPPFSAGIDSGVCAEGVVEHPGVPARLATRPRVRLHTDLSGLPPPALKGHRRVEAIPPSIAAEVGVNSHCGNAMRRHAP